MHPSLNPEVPGPLVTVAVAAANEGIPVTAIARILALSSEAVYVTLKAALSQGSIAELPRPDWPPTARMSDRVPVVAMKMTNTDMAFHAQRIFKLTKLEAAILVALIRSERADKEKLHNVVEQQRASRAQQPQSLEATDPKMVDVIICKLRKKLKDVNETYVIKTLWGVGYYIVPEVRQAISDFIDKEK